MNSSKAAIVVSQIIEKIEMICGGVWTAFFLLGFIAIIADDEQDGAAVAIVILLMAALGILVFLLGHKRKQMRLTFKKYVAQLSVDPTGSLENIAGATGTSVDVVKKNVQYMIKKRFFSNAYLDEMNNQLILSSASSSNTNTDNVGSSVVQNNEETVYVTCNCPNCGGVNKIIKGNVAECDFCGSVIGG